MLLCLFVFYLEFNTSQFFNLSIHQVPLVCLSISLAIADNLIHVQLFLEAGVELIDIDRVFFLFGRVHCDVEGWVDSHVARQPVLIVQVVEGDGGHRGVWIALLVSCVGNERCQVFFKLREIICDVTLSEIRVLVVGHGSGHASLETTCLEIKGQVLAE